MSFFDEGDEPTRGVLAVAAAGQAAPTGHGLARRRRTARPPDRCASARRSAVGAALLLADPASSSACGLREQRKERALKDYNRDVTAVVDDSDSQVGKPFFRLMASGARQGDAAPGPGQPAAPGRRRGRQAAKGFDVPGDMRPAQRQPRCSCSTCAPTGLRKIADEIPRAQGRGQPSEDAIDKIAGQMQQFLASDVVYTERVAPLVKDALDDERDHRADDREQPLPARHRVAEPRRPSPTRLGRTAARPTSTTVGAGAPRPQPDERLGGHRGAAARGARRINRVASVSSGPTFAVKFANQGDNDESQRPRRRSRVSGAGTPITQTKTIAQTKSKADSTVSIPLGKAPPVGQRRDRRASRSRRCRARRTPTTTSRATPSSSSGSCAAWTTLDDDLSCGSWTTCDRGSSRWRVGGARRADRCSARAARCADCASDQRAVLGDANTDLVAHAAGLDRGFGALQRLRRPTSPRASTAASPRPSGGSTARSPSTRSSATTPTTRCPGASRPRSRCSTPSGSGVVLSSIHHRDQARLYAKQVVAGRGELELSPEEEEAIRVGARGRGARRARAPPR